MLTKNDIKRISALGAKKHRQESGLFIVEGEKMVAEALASDFEVVEVHRAAEIGEDAMARITCLSSPSPVLAVCRQKGPSSGADSNHACLKPGLLYLALDGIKDPGNLGTILRIADWFGVEKVFLSEDCVEIYNPKVVQSTMGAIFRVPFEYCSLPSVTGPGIEVLGTFLGGNNIYEEEVDFSKPVVIVIGSESFGIREQMAPLCNKRLTIPSYKEGGSESLNAAIATAITVAEIRRR